MGGSNSSSPSASRIAEYDAASLVAPRLGDRVVNLTSLGVPFGLRGTVVSIHENTGYVEVLFDEEFTGGKSLQGACSPFRGRLVPWTGTLKVSPTSLTSTDQVSSSSSVEQAKSAATQSLDSQSTKLSLKGFSQKANGSSIALQPPSSAAGATAAIKNILKRPVAAVSASAASAASAATTADTTTSAATATSLPPKTSGSRTEALKGLLTVQGVTQREKEKEQSGESYSVSSTVSAAGHRTVVLPSKDVKQQQQRGSSLQYDTQIATQNASPTTASVLLSAAGSSGDDEGSRASSAALKNLLAAGAKGKADSRPGLPIAAPTAAIVVAPSGPRDSTDPAFPTNLQPVVTQRQSAVNRGLSTQHRGLSTEAVLALLSKEVDEEDLKMIDSIISVSESVNEGMGSSSSSWGRDGSSAKKSDGTGAAALAKAAFFDTDSGRCRFIYFPLSSPLS